MRECRFCGQLFQEENGHQVFCSEHCRREQQNLLRRIKRKEKISTRDWRPRRSHLEWTDKDIQDRINTKSSKIAYIGGYSGSEGWIYVHCEDCGNYFKYSAKNLRRQRPIHCKGCTQILQSFREEESKRKAIEKEKELLAKRVEQERIFIENHIRICQRCGKEYWGTRKYCSKKCADRQQWSKKEHTRRIRINNNIHSDNISLPLLAKRDNNTCWLCKQKVDWTDFKRTEEGYFIAGENYPSVDHVQPLSKNGTHTWDNVRLAHKHCNTVKNNNLLGEKENGQIILFC